jgi:hypothetical protein
VYRLVAALVVALSVPALAMGHEKLSADAGGGVTASVRLMRSDLGDPLLDAGTSRDAKAAVEQFCPPCVEIARSADRWIWMPGAVWWSEGTAIYLDPHVEMYTEQGDTVQVERVLIFRGRQRDDASFYLAKPPALIPPGWHMPEEDRRWCGAGLLFAVPRWVDPGQISGWSFRLR